MSVRQRLAEVYRQPGPGALLELGLLFLPGIPAFFWLWPVVGGDTGQTVQVLAYFYMLAGGLAIGLRRWRPAGLGLSRQGVGLSLACGLALLVGRTLVVLAVDWPGEPQALSLRRVLGDLAFYFGLVGLVEELLFRGLLYQALDVWRGTRWAIWGSAAGFGLFHIGWRSPMQALGSFLIGLILATIRWRAGGIAGLILVHGAIDVATVWMAPAVSLEALGQPVIPHLGQAWLGFGLILAIPIYLWRVYPRRLGRRPEAAGGDEADGAESSTGRQ